MSKKKNKKQANLIVEKTVETHANLDPEYFLESQLLTSVSFQKHLFSQFLTETLQEKIQADNLINYKKRLIQFLEGKKLALIKKKKHLFEFITIIICCLITVSTYFGKSGLNDSSFVLNSFLLILLVTAAVSLIDIFFTATKLKQIIKWLKEDPL